MKHSIFLFSAMVLALLSQNNLNGQCYVEDLSPSSFDFTESGGTQTNSIVYTNGSCTYSLSFSNIPSWITSITQPNSHQVVVTCQANLGGSRSALINYSYDGRMQGFAITQDANPNPPPAPGNPTVVSNSIACGEAILQRSGNPPSGVTWYWQGTNSSGTSTSSAHNAANNTYTATQSGTYYIRARGSNGLWSTSGSRAVSIVNLTGGIIMDVDPICYGGDPDLINSFEDAGGSNGNHSYQWEWAIPGSNSWNTITNATGSTYNPPSGLQNSRSYRRVANCGSQTENSNTVTVSVKAPLEGGTITNPSAICSGEDPATLSATSATNGNGTYDYQWEWALEGSSIWSPINGETNSQYNPPVLTQTRKYRRQVISCGQTAVSNEVTITVNTIPSAPTGSGAYTICDSGSVTLQVAPGANGNVVRWYTASSGGTYFHEGDDYTTPTHTDDVTYYVTTYNDETHCETATRRAIGVNVSDLITYYLDEDRDGYYIEEVQDCTNPNPTLYVTVDTILGSGDCDDNDDTGHVSEIWYLDADDDGYYISFVTNCGNPGTGYKNTGQLFPGDCDDDLHDPDNDCGGSGSSNVQANNYVYSRSYQKNKEEMLNAGQDQSTFDFFTASEHVVQEITYFDGVGRPIQQIGLEQTPEISNVKKDIVTHVEYDDYGRSEKEWLPYTADLGTYGVLKTDPVQETLDFYNVVKYNSTANPFSQKKFEESPLNRVEQQAAPGNDWALGNGHEIDFVYQTNTHDRDNMDDVNNDNVRLYSVALTFTNDTYTPTLANDGYYGPGELRKNITYDENHTSGNDHSIEEFTDKQGRVVLKRTYNNNEPHDTYYIYNDFGNLSYVIPPLVDTSAIIDQTVLENLCYQYVYDHRNRLVEKQLPGKEREYIVYNKLDQPILTQDANQRDKSASSDEWLFTKYDSFGRLAYTGIATATEGASRPDIQAEVDSFPDALWVSYQTADADAEFEEDVTIFYDNGAYPNNDSAQNWIVDLTEVLTINYYDGYDWVPQDWPTSPSLVFGIGIDGRTKGLATGSRIKVLGTSDWITSKTGYDDKGRPIYAYSENEFLETTDVVESELDFVGKPLRVRSAHTRNSVTVTTLDNFEYDHVGRLLKQTECIGNANLGYDCNGTIVEPHLVLENETINSDKEGPSSVTIKATSTLSGELTVRTNPALGGTGGEEELIVFNDYDELGQLKAKKVGGDVGSDYTNTAGLQTVHYAYNVRGWLKSINEDVHSDNDLFDFVINYNTSAHGGTPLYNGNIAETQWETANDNQQRWYSYTYDALNRITTGISSDGFFDLGSAANPITYDKNGNIQTLLRMGQVVASPDIGNASDYGTMDDLAYAYVGNQLMRVTDNATVDQFGFKDDAVDTAPDGTDDYSYDVNGNMTQDDNKGITGIAYNHLNLPTIIDIDNGMENGTISYIYDAAGTKLRKTAGSSVTDYAGNYVYTDNGGTPYLEFLSQPEGYISPDGQGGYDYVYQYKDHLGNVRLSYADANQHSTDPVSLEIISENNYYPFGLKHKGYNIGGATSLGNDVAQKWKFGGKELDDSFNDALATYDFGARNYDPALGRWMNIDPLAFKYYSYSPYIFAANSPLVFVDPDGKQLILAGNRRERRQLFREVKKLSNDRLKLNRKTGEVTVRGNGGRNKNQNLAEGTSLVAGIIGSENTVTAMTLGGFKNKYGTTKTLLGTTKNQDVLDRTGNFAAPGRDNPLLQIGKDNALVVFDKNDSGKEVLNEDGSSGRPNHIGLAHELIHGSRIINGEVVEGTELSQDFIDPDAPSLGPGGNPNIFHDEEMEVRDIDNLIRQEHQFIKRASPIYVNPNKDLNKFLKKINNGGRK